MLLTSTTLRIEVKKNVIRSFICTRSVRNCWNCRSPCIRLLSSGGGVCLLVQAEQYLSYKYLSPFPAILRGYNSSGCRVMRRTWRCNRLQRRRMNQPQQLPSNMTTADSLFQLLQLRFLWRFSLHPLQHFSWQCSFWRRPANQRQNLLPPRLTRKCNAATAVYLRAR